MCYMTFLMLDMRVTSHLTSIAFTFTQDNIVNCYNNFLKLWSNAPACIALEKSIAKHMLKKTSSYWSKDFNRFCVEVRISDSALWLFYSVVVRLKACGGSALMTLHEPIYHRVAALSNGSECGTILRRHVVVREKWDRSCSLHAVTTRHLIMINMHVHNNLREDVNSYTM